VRASSGRHRPHYKALGEAGSTLDFGFACGGNDWLVELMRLEETAAVRRASGSHVDEDGTRWFSRIPSTGGGKGKESPEGETLKAVERICQKCERDGRATKFPVPGGAYHTLLVDFRTVASGGDAYDRIHIGLGGENVPPEMRHLWEGKPISGVFSPRTVLRGAAFIRERVHFLGFVNEKSYEPGAFGAAIQFIANPNVFESAAEADAALAT
jgi:hypothetical protein